MKLKQGDKAPMFVGKNQDGKIVSLSDFNNKMKVIYFYPKDMTPGCTAQACNLTENYAALQKLNIEVIGISADDEHRHKRFADKYNLPFNIIADVNKEIINAYGVWGPKKFMGREFDGIHRKTFLLDEENKIIDIIEKPTTKNHSEEIVKILKLKNRT